MEATGCQQLLGGSGAAIIAAMGLRALLRRPGLTKRNALRTFVSTQMAAASKKAHKRDQQKSRPIQFNAEAAARCSFRFQRV